MIGNTDWSIAKQHNTKLFVPYQTSGDTRPFAIPYDFDYSGLVDAHYAVVSSAIPVEVITDRYYLGYCCGDVILEQVLKNFTEKREAILGIFEKDSYLNEKNRREVIDYLTSFFDQLIEPTELMALLQAQCKK